MRALRRLFVACALVTSGLAIVGVAAAPPASATGTPCTGSCGDLEFQFNYGNDSSAYGSINYYRGELVDDSGSCFATGSQVACNYPEGTMDWVDSDGTILDSSPVQPDPIICGHCSKFEVTNHTAHAGLHQTHVEYIPGNFDHDGAVHNFTVGKAETDVTLTQSSATSVAGQATTLTATVLGVARDDDYFGGYGHLPQGFVKFFDGGTQVGIAALNNSATAQVSVDLGAGSHTLVAVFPGESEQDYKPGNSLSITHTEVKGNVTQTLTQTAGASVTGQAFTITSTIAAQSPATAPVTGTVTFTDTTTNTALGVVTLDAARQASIAPPLAVGAHSISAVFSGNADYNGKTSTTSHTVNKGDSAEQLTQTSAASVFGEPYSFGVDLTAVAPAVGTPTGTVTLTDGGTTLATPSLVTGHATVTGPAAVGSHPITAAYAGDDNFNGATNSLTHVVNRASTTVALSTPSPEPLTFGDPVTFNAAIQVVAPGAGVPTGTVQFSDNGSPLGAAVAVSGGAASITVPSLGGGVHVVTAAYSGDTNFIASTSNNVTRTVPCTRTVTGRSSGVTGSGTTCVQNATIEGPLNVPAGASVSLVNSTVTGAVSVSHGGVFRACGSLFYSTMNITDATEPITLGAPGGSCAPNSVYGNASFSRNDDGITLFGNQFNGTLTLTNNTGPSLVGGNRVNGRFTCTGNSPAPTNGGAPNHAPARSGQCGASTF